MREQEIGLSFVPRSRLTLLMTTIAVYAIPLAVILSMTYQSIPTADLWTFSTSGTLAILVGACAQFLLITYWEASLHPQRSFEAATPELSAPEESEPPYAKQSEDFQHQLGLLQHEMFLKEEHMRHLEEEKEYWSKKHELLEQEHFHQQRNFQDELDKLNRLLHEAKTTLGEQRAAMELNLERMNHLETKNDDLRYEIKTLLQVSQNSLKNEIEALDTEETKEESIPYVYTPRESVIEKTAALDRPVKNIEDAVVQLRRCMDIAQKFSGSHSVSGSASRYRTAPAGGFALDMRQLFDALRHEQSAAIMFYSSNENKPLFINAAVKLLLGWSPETFVQHFPEIIADGIQEWRHSLAELRTKNETLARIPMKGKSGHEVLIHCLLGRISSGLFKNHIISIFYLAS